MLYTVRQFIYSKQACIVALLGVGKPRLRKNTSKIVKRKYKLLKFRGYGEIREKTSVKNLTSAVPCLVFVPVRGKRLFCAVN